MILLMPTLLYPWRKGEAAAAVVDMAYQFSVDYAQKCGHPPEREISPGR